MKLLPVLPFTNTKNISSVFNSKTAPNTTGEKDVYYRALANQKINWRNLLLLFVKRYLQVDTRFSQTKNNTKCLIFDDTDNCKNRKNNRRRFKNPQPCYQPVYVWIEAPCCRLLERECIYSRGF